MSPTLLALLLLCPPAQAQPVPTAAPTAAEVSAAKDPAAQVPAVEAPAAGAPAAAPARVWTPVPPQARVIAHVPMLGPWPDDWRPAETGQAGLPTLDMVLGDVLDPGHPYVSGQVAGPRPPTASPLLAFPAALVPVDAAPAATTPATAVPGAPVDAAPATAVPAAVPAAAPAAVSVAPVAVPAPAATPDDELATLPLLRRSIAEELLPAPPRHGPRRALLYFALGVMLLLGAGLIERLQDRVRKTGLAPQLLGGLTGLGRGLTLPLFLVAVLSLLPRSWSLAVPFALVSLAVALGWSTRDLLADIFAGVVLTVERRAQQGDRLEIGPHRGIVHNLGLRSTRITVDDGRMLSIPNRQLLQEVLRIDPDAYAPVQVPVPVHPHLTAGEVRQRLQELALLSPYIAPSRPPNVYRDADRPDLWIVEARLVHPRYANAFRGAMVELADEELNQLRDEER